MEEVTRGGERLKEVFEGEMQTAGSPIKDYQVCMFGFLTETLSEDTFWTRVDHILK